MIHIINQSNSPYFNLALEEYVLTENKTEEKIFFLWQNEPTVVVGRNQNTTAEINQEVVKEKGINVVRRLSGGGAVYHDLGNLNFTFIVTENSRSPFDFQRFTKPIIKTLDSLGIKAKDSGRNDITINDRKFSGNAQYKFHNRLLHHGTILFSTRIEDMVEVLNVSNEKIAARGITSVKSRVTNISEHLSEPISIEQFKNLLTQIICAEEKTTNYSLSEEQLAKVKELAQRKYSTWEWNYGASPQFNVRKAKKFEWGTIEFLLEIKQGKINNCKICGDFFASDDIIKLEQYLSAISYNAETIKQVLSTIDITRYLPHADVNELTTLLTEPE